MVSVSCEMERAGSSILLLRFRRQRLKRKGERKKKNTMVLLEGGLFPSRISRQDVQVGSEHELMKRCVRWPVRGVFGVLNDPECLHEKL